MAPAFSRIDGNRKLRTGSLRHETIKNASKKDLLKCLSNAYQAERPRSPAPGSNAPLSLRQ